MLKKLFVVGGAISVSFAVALVLLPIVISDATFKLEDGCNYDDEYLKVMSQYGKRYHDLPLDQRIAFDNEFNQIGGMQTQEEFESEYEKLLDKYDITAVWYSDEEMQKLFYELITLCRDL